MKSYYILIITVFGFLFKTHGQSIEQLVIDPDYIKSVTFNKPPEDRLPIYQIGETISLEFDDLIADEADYYYQIQHYDYDWKLSRLFKNEFLDGLDDIRIFNYRNSFTTLQAFSHYTMSIPNQFTKGVKVSGNYMIHIYNSDRQIVFSRRFMIIENLAAVSAQVKRSRDLEFVEAKQRLQFEINSQNLNFITPKETLKVALIQNADFNTAIYNVKPQYNLGNKQLYNYDKETAFWAGNEFLNFENRDFRAANNFIDYVRRKELYEAHLFVQEPRVEKDYTYFPDINGNFLITTVDNADNAVQAEYVNIHFGLKLDRPLPPNSALYVTGNYNTYQLQPEALLIQNEDNGIYEAMITLKQGFYNYRYSLVYDNGTIDNGYISGNKWPTENAYDILVYYREPGGRYDRLIGIGNANSINITN